MAENPEIEQRGIEAALHLIEGGNPAEVKGSLDLKQLSLQLGRSANLLERKHDPTKGSDSLLLNVQGVFMLVQRLALKPEASLDEILKEENVKNILKHQAPDQYETVAKAEAQILTILGQIAFDHHDDVIRQNASEAWQDPEFSKIVFDGAALCWAVLTSLHPRMDREAPLVYSKRLRGYIEIARQKLISESSSRAI